MNKDELVEEVTEAKVEELVLEDLTVDQLRDRASELEVKGRSGMNKDELVTAIRAAEDDDADGSD